MANIGRATVILDSIAESRWPMTLTDLATRTGLPRSTVHRVIQALERELYVVRVPDRSGYILGPGLLKFGMNAHLRLLSANRSQLATLARTVNENVEWRSSVVARLSSSIRLPHRKGSEASPRSARAFRCMRVVSGRPCLLSCRRSRQLRCCHRFYHDLRIRRSPNGRRCWRNWRRCVAPTSSVDIEEHDVGICAVATAMIGPTGALQAIAIVIPSGRFKAKKELAVEGLKVVNSQVDLGLSRAQF